MRGKVAHDVNRVNGYGCVWSSLLAGYATAFSFPQIHRYLTLLYFTPRRVYKIYARKFKRLVRELCRERMEPYFKRWKVGL
jgi:hypothetical protein